MKALILAITFSFFFAINYNAQEPTACGTLVDDLESATLEELGKEYRRLASYNNPYCDTTNSNLHKLMKLIALRMSESKATAEKVVTELGEPYYQGPLSDYENQKVILSRNGKMLGKVLPPQFKIPSGEYYVVYFWRNKDYLTFAFKADQCTEYGWWEKGNYR